MINFLEKYISLCRNYISQSFAVNYNCIVFSLWFLPQKCGFLYHLTHNAFYQFKTFYYVIGVNFIQCKIRFLVLESIFKFDYHYQNCLNYLIGLYTNY